MTEEGPVSKISRRSRNARLAKLGGQVGGAWGVNKAKRVFADAERKEELDREFELKSAEQVVKSLGNMKGAFMKLGQMASYLDQGMPEPVRKALSSLQQDAPPMSREFVDETVEAELGSSPAALFAEFDNEPIAAASIGQVHRALTHDGQAVAVKVQYPGVADAIRNDMDNADMLFRVMKMTFPSLDPKPLVEELKARLVEEVDYEMEARNQTVFADYYEGHPYIHVPRVLSDLSTRRVLTTELASGHRFEDVLTWSQEEKDLTAETLYRFTFGSMYRLLAFNGDPHPGNYIFRPGGQVSFLDFGLVKHYTSDDIDGFMQLIEAMVVTRDMATYRRFAEEQDLLMPNAPIDDETVGEYFQHFYEFVLHDGEYTITSDYAAKTVRQIFANGGENDVISKHTNVPSRYVVVQRINLGLLAIFGDLNATANWRRIAEELWPFILGEPSTPMARHIREVWGDGSTDNS